MVMMMIMKKRRLGVVIHSDGFAGVSVPVCLGT